MSEALATPNPGTTPRRLIARLWEDPESRSVMIGLLGVLLIHLLLFFTAPYWIRFERRPTFTPRSTARQFNIELNTDISPPPKPKPVQAKHYVETNPDAPENTPD